MAQTETGKQKKRWKSRQSKVSNIRRESIHITIRNKERQRG